MSKTIPQMQTALEAGYEARNDLRKALIEVSRSAQAFKDIASTISEHGDTCLLGDDVSELCAAVLVECHDLFFHFNGVKS